MILAAFAAAIAALIATAHGLNDYDGRPLGTDFSNVYAAGMAVLHGEPTAPFDITRQWAQEKEIFGAKTPLYGWHYPPFFLLIAAPLAHLPYSWALALWQISTLVLYLWALFVLLRQSAAPDWAGDYRWLPLALAFTAVFVNLTHGHNGFLTAALVAGGLSQLDSRPWLAGLLFGLLAYKPQFGVMIPLALAAGGYWRSFAGAAGTVLILAGAVTLLFGAEVWTAFLASTHFTRTVILEQGSTGFEKIQSVFSQIRFLGGDVTAAYAAQAVISLLAVFLLLRLWHRPARFGVRGAALCLATLLGTPYMLDYDLMLLAPALLLLAAEGKARGFHPFELSLLAFLWFLPFMARGLAEVTHILLAPFVILALLAMISRPVKA